MPDAALCSTADNRMCLTSREPTSAWAGPDQGLRLASGYSNTLLRRIEPLRLVRRTSGPPLPTAPATCRFSFVPMTLSPCATTEPDPVVASIATAAVEQSRR